LKWRDILRAWRWKDQEWSLSDTEGGIAVWEEDTLMAVSGTNLMCSNPKLNMIAVVTEGGGRGILALTDVLDLETGLLILKVCMNEIIF
jgi:hypothetical protein